MQAIFKLINFMIIPNNSEQHRRQKAHNSFRRPGSAVTNNMASFHVPEQFFKRKSTRAFIDSRNKTTNQGSRHYSTVEKEELIEQNIATKKEVNRLAEELSIMKGRMATARRHHKSSKVEMEFDKELYWKGSQSHMISGIKRQYEKLQQQCKTKSQQVLELQRELAEKKVPELEIYIQQLEIQNRRLASKLNALEPNLKEMKPQKEKKVSEYLLVEMEEKNKNMELKMKKLIKQTKTQEQQLEVKDKKITFLEDLVKQLENKENKVNQKTRKAHQQKVKATEQKQLAEKRLLEARKESIDSINALQSQHEAELKECERSYLQVIAEKENKIQELSQNTKFLEQALHNIQMMQSSVPNTRLRNKESISPGQKNDLMTHSINLSVLKEFQQQLESEQNRDRVRKQQTADERHSENSKKMRRVEQNEIEDIVEFLKYKIVEADVPEKELKDYFNFRQKQNEEYMMNEEGEIWEQQYITMGQTLQILMSRPFSLPEEDALLLSRYIVEDAQGQYIYCDVNNEQKRQIVKSIIKSLLGGYELCSEETKEKYNETIGVYESNILSALKTICPSGYVTKRKFLEVLGGLGIETTPEAKEYVIAKLAAVSTSLSELKYKSIFRQP